MTEPWEDVLAAERVYYEARRRMHDAGRARQLHLAFQDPHGRSTALRSPGARTSGASSAVSKFPSLSFDSPRGSA